ncbi:uncharacterized protein [Asterias amurensis]|uniref:uncharacterized protein n=1 Tax=Asterias amurensis TaxID=7602 RepID=UPI003AB90205
MASNVTVNSLLDKISKDYLECPICTNRFINPTMLDCLHSFCFTCLKELHQQDPNNSILLCPLCRKKTTLQDTTIESLPKDFKLNALGDEVSDHERLIEGHRSKVKCQACDEENEAVSRCMECECFLCCECQRAHQRLAFMKSHKIQTLAQLKADGVTFESQVESNIPELESYDKYCQTCLKLAFTTCSNPDKDSPKHDVIGVPEVLSNLVSKLKTHQNDIHTAMVDIKDARSKLDQALITTESKITQNAAKKFAEITEEEKKLKEEVKRIYQDRIKTFETAEETYSKEKVQAERKLDEVNKLMAQTSRNKFLDLKEELLPNLDELTSEKAPTRLSFMDFEEDEGLLGRLVLEDEQSFKEDSMAEIAFGLDRLGIQQDWRLKQQFKLYGIEPYSINSVTAFSNNEIIMADIQNNRLIRTSLKDNGRYDTRDNPQRLKLTGLNNPYRAAMNKKDQLLVLDGRSVKVFSKIYQLLHQFTPGARSGRWPSCLAVSDNNQIAVGYKNKEEIALHRESGYRSKTLSAPGMGYYMTTYKQQFIYTNTFLGKLISVDYDGEVIFSVDVKSGRPYGVCCDDRNGSIFVVIAKTSTSDEIQQYSHDGKYIGRIIKDCGLLFDIAFTATGELVVVTNKSVKTYSPHEKTQ